MKRINKHKVFLVAPYVLLIISLVFTFNYSSKVSKQKRTIHSLTNNIEDLESQVNDLQNEVYDLEDYKNAMESILNKDNDTMVPLDTTLLNIK